MHFVHIANVGKYRKLSKIGYPHAYAPEARTDTEANLFNCAQRAHSNFIENQVSAVGALLVAGVGFPKISAAFGLGWSISRFIYMKGYNKGGDGKGRYRGMTFWLFQLGLIVLAGWTGTGMILGW